MRRFILASLVVAIFTSLLTAQTTKPQVVNLAVAGMHCENCVTKVDKALRGVEGVKDVKVDLKSQSAVVTLAVATVKSDVLIKAVSDVGFEASLGKAVSSTSKEEKCEGCSEKDSKKEGAEKKEDCCKPEKTKKKTNSKS
jgi:copper chaperone CopZ